MGWQQCILHISRVACSRFTRRRSEEGEDRFTRCSQPRNIIELVLNLSSQYGYHNVTLHNNAGEFSVWGVVSETNCRMVVRFC